MSIKITIKITKRKIRQNDEPMRNKITQIIIAILMTATSNYILSLTFLFTILRWKFRFCNVSLLNKVVFSSGHLKFVRKKIQSTGCNVKVVYFECEYCERSTDELAE